ncbi:hypothetical protein [Nesterenkonia ebinurensis]|uniref:hypothetical protein n=1 Tax=Nesterenkonia ebinurensis TaxID=2608252 RepID=UPI00123CE28A|nr:hypothetical protein [Nesterenkonia ebinurensis]
MRTFYIEECGHPALSGADIPHEWSLSPVKILVEQLFRTLNEINKCRISAATDAVFLAEADAGFNVLD